MLRDKDWKKIGLFLLGRFSSFEVAHLFLAHTRLWTFRMCTYVCVLTVCTVFLHIQKTFVWVRVQAVSLRPCMRVLVFPLTVRARMCVCLIHGIVDTLRCVLCCGVCMCMCMYASYTYCVYSRTFFFELRKTHQTQREILYTPLIRNSCEMRKNWLGWLLGRVGRSLIYFQSIGFFLR